MPHWPVPIGNKPIDLGLTRVRSLLSKIGNPERKLPPIIHVAGTNGKGSTTAFLKSIWQAAGYKVHCYTSPHLVSFNERINILGTNIDDDLLYEVCEECRLASEAIDIRPTFFEGTTVAALLAFSKIEADLVILETGLGGRLDATNVIDNPLFSIITSISFDHTEYLGNSLDLIAREKSGIIKKNCPTIISQQYSEAMEVILKFCDALESKSYAFEYDWMVLKNENNLPAYRSKDKELLFPRLGLIGDHQYINAGNAITAALQAKDFKIKDEDIISGLTKASWPARLQRLLDGEIINKLPKNWEIWVDGAHNEAGAHVLSMWLEESPEIPTYMIFGMTRGRDCQKFLNSFKGKIKHIGGVLIEAEPSSYGSEYIKLEAVKAGFDAQAYEDVDQALFEITKKENDPARIIICGSLYLAGDILYKNQRFYR